MAKLIAIEETYEPGTSSLSRRARDIFYAILLSIGFSIFLKGTIAEARFIPSGSMQPTLQINDRVLIDKLSYTFLKKKIQRGDIVVFYPPAIETGHMDDGLMGRFIPVLPENPPAFIKRVIGLPGDRIVIKRGIGVFINGKLLDEAAYTADKPNYNLTRLGDIKGNALDGTFVEPFPTSQDPIIVPERQLFMLGDNRNNSADSHVWGFVDEDRVVGRTCAFLWKDKWLSSLMVNH